MRFIHTVDQQIMLDDSFTVALGRKPRVAALLVKIGQLFQCRVALFNFISKGCGSGGIFQR